MKMIYAKVSLRGFSNEFIIYEIPEDKMSEFENEYGDLEDRANGDYTHVYKNPKQWVRSRAVAWDDRDWM